MAAPYPLRFRPLFRRYIWGGRRLASVLNKPIGEGDDYAESWEVVDHGEDQSVVACGEAEGATLGELCRAWGEQLLGSAPEPDRFPLLFKFLDAHRNLSVQVHPNDDQGRRLTPPDLGKTEAWVILAAEPGSVVYAGLKRGMDRAALEREIHRGTTELCLHRVEPKVGDCLFIPAGVVHALGEGLMVAEIQQASDTTFRLFDWNRAGADGKPRELHIEQGLEVIDYERGGVDPQVPAAIDDGVERLVACDKFVLNRLRLDRPRAVGGDGRFRILAVLEGALNIAGDSPQTPLTIGQTVLLPAALDRIELTPSQPTTLLEMHLP